MILTLDTERLRTLEEIRTFMEGNRPVDFRSAWLSFSTLPSNC